MQKIRLKGVGRPKKRRGHKNPFDLCLLRKMFKKNKEAPNGSRALPLISKNLPLEGSRKEAHKIVKVAKRLGLQRSQNQKDGVKAVTDQ